MAALSASAPYGAEAVSPFSGRGEESPAGGNGLSQAIGIPMLAGCALVDHQGFDMRGVLDLGAAVVAPGMAGDDR
jgi:hypothetical protein